MSYKFNYFDFYNYYVDPKNIITDTENCVSLYFYNNPDKNKSAKLSSPKCSYIVVNNEKIYISKTNKSNIYIKNGVKIVEKTSGLNFSILTLINGIPFDFHYHFGIRTELNYNVITDKVYISNNKKQNRFRKNLTKKNIQLSLESDNINLDIYSPVVDNLFIDPNEQLIYFHKTIQQLHNIDSNGNINGKNIHENCYF